LKKPIDSVLQTWNWKNWTEPNPNRKKPSQTEKTKPNRFEPVFVLKNRTQNRSVWTGFGFFFKKIGLVAFFKKNQTKPKIITPTPGYMNLECSLFWSGYGQEINESWRCRTRFKHVLYILFIQIKYFPMNIYNIHKKI